MQSNHKVYKLPFQTKIVFIFILLLTVSLVVKWTLNNVLNESKVSQIEQKFSSIKVQVVDVCLKEESKSIKSASDLTEDDQDWINFKAPEYCRCVSSRMLAIWSEQQKLETIYQINEQRRPGYITAQLKSDESKPVIDLCLSRAQKISGKKVTASTVKN